MGLGIAGSTNGTSREFAKRIRRIAMDGNRAPSHVGRVPRSRAQHGQFPALQGIDLRRPAEDTRSCEAGILTERLISPAAIRHDHLCSSDVTEQLLFTSVDFIDFGDGRDTATMLVSSVISAHVAEAVARRNWRDARAPCAAAGSCIEVSTSRSIAAGSTELARRPP